MTPEGKVKEAVKKVLKQFGAWYFMPVSNGYGKHGIPDFIGVLKGRFFAIETKAPGGVPTPRQEIQIAEIQVAEGRAFVVAGDTATLEMWMKEVTA